MADTKGSLLPVITDPVGLDRVVLIDDPAGTPVLKSITIDNLWKMLAQADPGAQAAGYLRIYAKDIGGRIVPKWVTASGVDTPFQPALFGSAVVLFAPNTGSVGTGTGFGAIWTPGGTVSHPTPTAGIVTQMRRTRFANIVTTQNQTLGVINTASGLPSFWRGNAAGLGGFFFTSRFIVELWPANTCRLFVGLTSLATGMVASDSPTGDFIGLWHDTTDGANVLSLIARNNTTTVKTAITGATLAAGQAFDFYLWSAPNGSAVYYRLVSVNSGTEHVNTSYNGASLPRNTIFMGPQAQMSNGTANTTVTTVALSIAKIYIESDN